MLCKRHLILHNGRIAASGTLEELRQQLMLPEASLEEMFLLLTRKDEN
jgi:ABC-2 type transport system ATP-binding protein